MSKPIAAAKPPAGLNSNPVSKVEQAILNAKNPIPITESEQITANGVRGIWANKAETANVKNLEQYKLHKDPNPQVIKKKPACCTEYKQEVAIKFLKPPEPPKPGDIRIKQLPDVLTPPAPPLVIRQPGKEACAPPNLVIRESPPKMPCPIPEKVVTIPGKTLPAPPRKVVVEKLPDAPQKPQNIVIERWLPVEEKTRKVVFERACPVQPLCPPKNVTIEWETPCVKINKEYKNLGVFPADPEEYRRKYNFNKQYTELPDAVFDIPIPKDVTLAVDVNGSNQAADNNPCSNCTTYIPKLEGDIDALRLIDLSREGLAEYLNQVN